MSHRALRDACLSRISTIQNLTTAFSSDYPLSRHDHPFNQLGLEKMGLCKSWTLDWTCGLDYGPIFGPSSGPIRSSTMTIPTPNQLPKLEQRFCCSL